MPDGMMFGRPADMLPIDTDELDALTEVIDEMLAEAGAICNESLHRQDIGGGIEQVASNVRSAKNRAWFPDPNFVEPAVLDATATFEDAAYDPDIEPELEEGTPTLDTLEAS